MIIKNTNEQLELTIQTKPCLAAPKSDVGGRRPRRVTTARLWFARMRQIVDSAHDWPARPIQPQLIPARTVATTTEHQLAE